MPIRLARVFAALGAIVLVVLATSSLAARQDLMRAPADVAKP